MNKKHRLGEPNTVDIQFFKSPEIYYFFSLRTYLLELRILYYLVVLLFCTTSCLLVKRRYVLLRNQERPIQLRLSVSNSVHGL